MKKVNDSAALKLISYIELLYKPMKHHYLCFKEINGENLEQEVVHFLAGIEDAILKLKKKTWSIARKETRRTREQKSKQSLV